MGHLLFIVMHAIAALFFLPALIVTIPLHLIYGAVGARGGEPKPTPWTHVKCPDCKELVRKDAAVCKHCGCKLIPQT